jgi:branched-chain amino acid aminotransferase
MKNMRINIQGELFLPEDARISVLDRGFLYGDSVYEVVRTYDGIVFAFEEHLQRLVHSAASLGISLPDRAWLRAQVERTIQAAGNPESYCRIVITRGSGPITLDPTTALGNCTVIFAKPYEPFPDWMYTKGIKVAIPSIRRNLQAALDPAIKSGNYLNSVLALGEARKGGFDDALMLDFKGRVTEATSSNVFAWKDSKLLTPKLDTGILEGVTRGFIIQLCRKENIPVEECDLFPDDLYAADEVMVTSTLKEVLPVTQVCERLIGGGKPGPTAARLRDLFSRQAKRKVHGTC